ncbi:MAG TPA: type II secretion system minor pseudopilin GspJ [Marinospirillum sp.]|uniref:type II secretion system minor pseudopilin GspJ n=1 Tax=Marinospirillum sp. TaxID=2183934 RepID=UPI002B479C54|nr:type II secretion system minor pseudopilin GspJ [Marinospirillum sp.]HKM15392.1 type II secretion system minor pseudopilin GspJ [Marinospirillum sp.]
MKHSQAGKQVACKQTGFTLLEVLVALAIMAALSAALALLVSQVLDARQQLSEVRSKGPEQLVDFLTRTDRQLSQLVIRQAHERGQAVNPSPLTLQNNNQELYWVAAGQWVLPLQDYASRLRLWRLSWNKEQKTLLLASSGLLDAADKQVWTVVDELEKVTALNWAFYRDGAWQNTLAGSFPKGLRLSITWQDEDYQRLILLPELMFITPQAAATNKGAGDAVSEED